MGVDDAGDRDPAARELFDDHRVGRQVEPHAAVLLGDRDAEQAELFHLLDDLLREGVLVVEVLGVGDDLLVGELADHLGDVALKVGLLAVGGGVYGHGSCSVGIAEGARRISARRADRPDAPSTAQLRPSLRACHTIVPLGGRGGGTAASRASKGVMAAGSDSWRRVARLRPRMAASGDGAGERPASASRPRGRLLRRQSERLSAPAVDSRSEAMRLHGQDFARRQGGPGPQLRRVRARWRSRHAPSRADILRLRQLQPLRLRARIHLLDEGNRLHVDALLAGRREPRLGHRRIRLGAIDLHAPGCARPITAPTSSAISTRPGSACRSARSKARPGTRGLGPALRLALRLTVRSSSRLGSGRDAAGARRRCRRSATRSARAVKSPHAAVFEEPGSSPTPHASSTPCSPAAAKLRSPPRRSAAIQRQRRRTVITAGL